MDRKIYQGRVPADGTDFNGWFIGDLSRWCVQNGVPYDPTRLTLRDTGALEVKWGVHPEGQARPGGWAGVSDKTCLSVLVRGRFLIRFRDLGTQEETYLRLETDGDYAVWRETVEHFWQAEQDSVILTVRWK